MDQTLVVFGFSTLAGLLAGYVLSRLGRGWMVLAAWVATAIAIIGYAIWLDSGSGPASSAVISVLYIVLIPFGIALVMGSVCGMVMRLIFGRNDAK